MLPGPERSDVDFGETILHPGRFAIPKSNIGL